MAYLLLRGVPHRSPACSKILLQVDSASSSSFFAPAMTCMASISAVDRASSIAPRSMRSVMKMNTPVIKDDEDGGYHRGEFAALSTEGSNRVGGLLLVEYLTG